MVYEPEDPSPRTVLGKLACSRRKRFKRETKATPESTEGVSYQVSSLTDLSARVVALNVSFGVVERSNNPPVPDELRLKIITLSFPEKEEVIENWAGFNASIVDIEKSEKLCSSGSVGNLIQIGT